MLSRRLPFLALVLGVAGGSFAVPAVGAAASAGDSCGREQPAKRGRAGGTRLLPRPSASLPSLPKGSAASDKLAPRDREERAALLAFYAARQHEPIWTTTAGLTPAAQLASPSFAARTSGVSMPPPFSFLRLRLAARIGLALPVPMPRSL